MEAREELPMIPSAEEDLETSYNQKRRRNPEADIATGTRDAFERLLEENFKRVEKELFARYELQLERFIEQRVEKSTRSLKHRLHQKLEQGFHQRFEKKISVIEEHSSVSVQLRDNRSAEAGRADSTQQGGSSAVSAMPDDTQKVDSRLRPSRLVWRVRGVPTNFEKSKLYNILRHHPDLQSPAIGGTTDNGVCIRSLALDLRGEQVAIVRFHNLPARLAQLKHDDQLTIIIQVSQDDIQSNAAHGPDKEPTSPTMIKFSIDQHFNGITVLFSPKAARHDVDVLAVSGLGSHPFGSFVHKGDGHMWLCDSLPQDMPGARIMIYGYQSRLEDKATFALLDDHASSLYVDLCRLLRSRHHNRLILIGHSLGGLLLKEALIRIADSNSERQVVDQILGALFFGVPNNGMDIESLIPIVYDQPNLSFLADMNMMSSQVLRLQQRNFATFLSGTTFKLFCFYETRLSPTAAKDQKTGKYKMEGPHRCLVTAASATSCLASSSSRDHSVAVDRTHSGLVKFASYDSEYEKTSYILSRILSE